MQGKIFKQKYYKHIDKPVDIKKIEHKVKNKEYIKKHGFYPFLSYTIKFKKYSKEIDFETKHHWKIKPRPIKYASHIDRCIYQWYSYKLNNKYNEYCKKFNLNNSAIAYRTCLKGKTNIEFASQAINFIKKCKECYILISDFTKFFEYIDHSLLKKNLCTVLNAKKLSEDFYKVFRSMTKYSFIERDDIEKYLIDKGVETKQSIKENICLFKNISWNKAKKDLKNNIQINNDTYGIPQGSPLSGIFANVYMIDFDRMATEYAQSKNGMYMRYSDDLIMIIPKSELNSISNLWKELSKIKMLYKTLEMNIEKTSGYLYKDNKITSLHKEISNMKDGGKFISYLGFSFDGKYVRFRDKTLTKFFYKLYRKIDNMIKTEKLRIEKGKKKRSKIDKHWILKELNSKKENRKFIDYVNRAKRVFYNEKYITNFRQNIKKKVFVRFDKKLAIDVDDDI